MDSLGPQYVFSPDGWVCNNHQYDLNLLFGLIGNSKVLDIIDKSYEPK